MRVSIVTPSFRQARFLERTLTSVLGQGWPDLEYMVVDGGSDDGSVEIIRRYADRLAWWTSEADRGQSHAINKGLQRATGDIVGWLNSDDTLAPHALSRIAEVFERHPEVQLVYGNVCLIDADDRLLRRLVAIPTCFGELQRFNRNLWSQPGTFWRRSLHTRLGWLDEGLHCTMDCDWWSRVARSEPIRHLPAHVANLRVYGETKSSTQGERFSAEHRLLDERYGGAETRWWRRRLFMLQRIGRIMRRPANLAYRLGWNQA